LSLPTREQAIQGILDKHGKDALYVFATGYIARTGFKLCWGKYDAFYMLGSMGLAPAICAGLRFQPRHIVVVNGDGAHSMMPRPEYFTAHYYVLWNAMYESTGGQRAPVIDGDTMIAPHTIKVALSPPDPRITATPKEIIDTFMEAVRRRA